MDNFTQRLIEEFGQGIVNHVSRNRGKYAIGAGVAGLAGYSAYNGNLGSAINNAGNIAAGTLGATTSDLPYGELPYDEILDKGIDSTKAVYTAEIDPEIPLIPDVSYDVGHAVGNFGAHMMPANVFESEEIDTSIIDEKDDDGITSSDATKAVALTVGGSAAVLAGVANADKIGRVIKNTKDHVASAAKGVGENTTRSLAKVLLNTSTKLKESKEKNDNSINERNTKADAKKQEKLDAAAKDAAALRSKLKTRSYAKRS